MRVADVEYTSGGQVRFERSQFEKTRMSLHVIVYTGRTDVVHAVDNAEEHLDGIMVLSWIQRLRDEGKIHPRWHVRRYEVRDFDGGRVLVNVYPLDQTGAVREVR